MFLHRHVFDPDTLFDPQLLTCGAIPDDFPAVDNTIIFLWQPASPRTLAHLARRYPRVPIIVGRFDAESPVYARAMRYWCAADFFPIRALIDLELAGHAARRAWCGAPMPRYHDMPLVDGDLPRIRFWAEALASCATLLLLRQWRLGLRVITDWVGARLARACGLRVRRLWAADWCDRNWPPRRDLRGRLARLGSRRTGAGSAAHPGSPRGLTGRVPDAEVVVLAGGWVEPRMLASFPVEALTREGVSTALWVHHETAAVRELVDSCGATCLRMDYPEPAEDCEALSAQVGAWCEQAALDGYFAPLRGHLAREVVRLMNWPRWVPKLVAMHQRLRAQLLAADPRLLIAPAEKDWTSYCGHHAARELGISSIGIKHAIWPPGSHLETFDDAYYDPTPCGHVLAYTPMDARRELTTADGGTCRVIWQGNPRLIVAAPECASADVRILVAPRGVGPGRGMSLRRAVLRANVAMTTSVVEAFGDRTGVRLHPWDSLEHYPDAIRGCVLPGERSLAQDLRDHAVVVTTYSTAAFDAAAAGRAVVLWDAEGLLGGSELERYAGAAVCRTMDEVVAWLHRFVEDAAFREAALRRAAAFRAYLREGLGDDPERHLARWLVGLARGSAAESADIGVGDGFVSNTGLLAVAGAGI